MRYRLLILFFLVFIWILGFSQKRTELSSHNFNIGIDNSGDKCASGAFFNPVAMDSLGIDFVVYHYRVPDGSVAEEVEKMKKLGADFQDAGLKVVVNVECGNWHLEMKSTDGYDWVRRPNNLHLFKFPREVLKTLSNSDAVWGVQYDELEHSQITRNLSITIDHPGIELVSLAEPTGMNFQQADSAVFEGAHSLVEECRCYRNLYVLGEHVWPVLFHNFARAGITPVYKQMKENWSNVSASCALGASLQYNQELWACLDFWHYNLYPGHSAEDLWGNLMFAYWLGVDKAYVESMGKHMYEIFDDDVSKIQLKERGKALSNFAKNYVPAHPRPYTFRDIEPEIAIIRFDDTEWGQGTKTYCTVNYKGVTIDYYWKDWLFGAYDLNSSFESEEWIKAWHTITHGRVKEGSLSWNAYNIYGGIPYRSFAPSRGVVVFDDKVTIEHLGNVKLAFLCGLYMSETTLKDISYQVSNHGLTVVTSKRFAPVRFLSDYSTGTKVFKDGKGQWIITDDMSGNALKEIVRPFLGNENEIVLKFKGNKQVILTISPEGKGFSQIQTIF